MGTTESIYYTDADLARERLARLIDGTKREVARLVQARAEGWGVAAQLELEAGRLAAYVAKSEHVATHCGFCPVCDGPTFRGVCEVDVLHTAVGS